MKRRSTTAAAGPLTGTQAVRRAMAVLRTFTDTHPEWGLSDLARAVELHKTTVFRLLGTLESEGMVMRNQATGGWRLGPDAIALGARALRATDLRAAAHAELARLAADSGETTTLEVLVEDEVLIVDEVVGRSLIGAAPSVGTRWPAHATSTGKVLLAARGTEEARSRRARGRLARVTSRTITSVAALEAELARIRERGYAVAQEELEEGFVAVGAPVLNHENRVVAAISVGGPASRLNRERIRSLAEMVSAGARRISRNLGASTGEPILAPRRSGAETPASTGTARRREARV